VGENEEFRGRMCVEIDHLYERLTDIESQIAELRAIVVVRLDAHESYHQNNEHRWGLIKWCHRYPFRLLALAASLAVALVGDLRQPLVDWFIELIHAIGR